MNWQQRFSCAVLALLILGEYSVCTYLSLDMARLTIHSDPSQRSQLLGLPGGAFLTLSMNCAAGFELFRYLRYKAGLNTGSAAEQSLAAMATVPLITLVAGLLLAVAWSITTGSDSFWWWIFVALIGGTPLLYWRAGYKAQATHLQPVPGASNGRTAPGPAGSGPPEAPSLWQRFSERSRRVVLVAQEEAATMHTDAVDTAHILLALLREEDNPVPEILAPTGLTAESLRPEIQSRIKTPHRFGSPHPRITAGAKQVLVNAARAAKQMGCEFIAPEHVLVGLVETSGLGAELLIRAGLDLATVSRQVQALYRPAHEEDAAVSSDEYQALQTRLNEMEAKISDLQAQLEQARQEPASDN